MLYNQSALGELGADVLIEYPSDNGRPHLSQFGLSGLHGDGILELGFNDVKELLKDFGFIFGGAVHQPIRIKIFRVHSEDILSLEIDWSAF
jgi:hypothetical protein